jgi:hypothetical protein
MPDNNYMTDAQEFRPFQNELPKKQAFFSPHVSCRPVCQKELHCTLKRHNAIFSAKKHFWTFSTITALLLFLPNHLTSVVILYILTEAV